MGIMKFAARKGAIGGTARWVGDRFLESLAVGLIDVENCQTSKGIKKELQKVVTLVEIHDKVFVHMVRFLKRVVVASRLAIG